MNNCPLCSKELIEYTFSTSTCSSDKTFFWYGSKLSHYIESDLGFAIISHNYYIHTSAKTTNIYMDGKIIPIPYENDPALLYQEIENKINIIKLYQ